MLNFDYLRIPNDDSDFEEEPEDELASAGFRVIGESEGEEDEDSEEDEEETAEEGLEPAEEDGEEDENDKASEDGPADGLQELEELERGYANIPLSYEDSDE